MNNSQVNKNSEIIDLTQMTLQEYQNVVVIKKLLVKESRFDNAIHMLLGLGSEVMSEMIQAALLPDSETATANQIEELGDALFFCLGFMHFENLPIPEISNQKFNVPDNLFESEIGKFKGFAPLELLLVSIGDLQTIFKKELISGVRKIGSNVNPDLSTYANNILWSLLQIIKDSDFDVQDVLYKNALKLNVRYSDGFTVEETLNRDIQKETDVLKS